MNTNTGNNTRKKALFALLLSVLCFAAEAQLSKFQALYVYNFAKNMNWPADDNDRPLQIAVIGDTELAGQIDKTLFGKKVGARPITVIEAPTVAKLPPVCDIVVLGESRAGQMPALLRSQEGKRTLLVACKAGLCEQGAGIAFVTGGAKLQFEISETNLATQGLKASKTLVSLGTKVN